MIFLNSHVLGVSRCYLRGDAHKNLPTCSYYREKQVTRDYEFLEIVGMKQKVKIVGMIRKADHFLVLKKNKGRIEDAPVWELPASKIRFGEQPEEAMARLIDEELSISVKKIKLRDVITFTEYVDSSKIYNLYIIFDIEIDENGNEKIKLGEKYSAYKFLGFNDDIFASVNLSNATASVLEIELGRTSSRRGGEVTIGLRGAASAPTIYIDGASRGNPGPSGIGYVIVDENGMEIKRGGEFIGFATSRVAEYFALKEGCEQAIELGYKTVRFVSDNLMMVNQMNGVYQIKNSDILQIYNDINNLILRFEAVAFVHVRREQNEVADAEANMAIDQHYAK